MGAAPWLASTRPRVTSRARRPRRCARRCRTTWTLSRSSVATQSIVLTTSSSRVLWMHPTCGPTQEDDIPGTVRYKTYEVLIEETKDTPSGKRTRWAYLPYSMHMAGPREAIQHMIIRKNFGCTHFIIGRDMAGSKSS